MNFVKIFLASFWSWLVQASFFVFFCWEFYFWTGPIFRPSPEPPAYPACAFGAPTHSITCLWLQPFPEKGEARNRPLPFSSCDEPNIVRSLILRTTGSRSRAPLRRTIDRSGELTFSCKSFILLLSKVMLGCFTEVRFATWWTCFKLTTCRALKRSLWSLVPRLFQFQRA